jgi:Ca2+-binding RTX toxin-like protein
MVLNQSTFQEVGNNAGIVWSRQRGTEAFSVSWTDLNNDGLLDLWVNGHGFNGPSAAYPDGKIPVRYINNGNGTFTRENSDFRRGSGGDVHASTIIDFDNDGDQDILSSAGGQLGEGEGQPNLFFVNNGGNLQNEASSRGLEYQIGRGRSSLWFDGNGDGLLDVLLLEGKRPDGQGPTAFFQQRPDGTFFNASSQVGLNVTEPSRYAQLGDLNGDGNLDLLIHGTYNFPLKVYDFSSNGAWQDITNQFSNLQAVLDDPPSDTTEDFVDTTAPRDSVIGDFNNDGFNDIFVVRSRTDVLASSVLQGSDTIVSADLRLRGESEIGFSFETGGAIAVDVFNFVGTAANLELSQIFIGASGRSITTAELAAFTETQEALKETANVVQTNAPNFALSPSDSSVVGIAADRSQKGLYIGYDPGSQTWEVLLSSPLGEDIQVAVDSSETISNLNSIGFTTPSDFSAINGVPDVLWVYNPDTGRYEDRSTAAGLDNNTMAQSVVSGDFDNDGDLDLYLANANPAFNEPNILYDNQGDGTFVPVPQAGGAAGTTVGPHRLDFEVGSRIAVADYDNNGFLDIFAGSTTDRSNVGTTYLGSPSQLFSNSGNDNNWLVIDLEGIESNRDGIGARVLLTTADGQTQLREQNSGIHHFAQNSQRIHFGLGSNSSISSLVIEWPSGTRLEFNNITEINRLISITEDGDIGEPGGPEPGAGNDSLTGTAVGDLLSGGDGNDTLVGLEGPDTLNGDNNQDSLDGGNNNDVLQGGNGDDVLISGEGADTLFGQANFDFLDGGNGNDSLIGGDGNDTLSGGNGNDTLIGARKNDVLIGGNDADTIIGGGASDRFAYETLRNLNDTIVDFQAGSDSLSFSASGFGGDLVPDTTLSADQFVIGTDAVDPSDRFIYNSNNGDLFYDADGTGANAQIVVAKLENIPALSNSDILITA